MPRRLRRGVVSRSMPSASMGAPTARSGSNSRRLGHRALATSPLDGASPGPLAIRRRLLRRTAPWRRLDRRDRALRRHSHPPCHADGDARDACDGDLPCVCDRRAQLGRRGRRISFRPPAVYASACAPARDGRFQPARGCPGKGEPSVSSDLLDQTLMWPGRALARPCASVEVDYGRNKNVQE